MSLLDLNDDVLLNVFYHVNGEKTGIAGIDPIASGARLNVALVCRRLHALAQPIMNEEDSVCRLTVR